MLKVTLDIFSGLPNPTWTLDGETAQTVLKEIQNTRGAITDIDADVQPLGYRGFIIEPQGTSRGGLPQAFRVKSSNSLNEAKAQEILKQWRRGGSRAISGSSSEKVPSESTPADTIPEGKTEQGTVPNQARSSRGQCPFVATRYDPRPWNQRDVIRRNNCYNYATRRQTNTFAQPGRASSFVLGEPLSAKRVIRGALLDGAHPTNKCLSAEEAPLVMALVFSPSIDDFHWYRLHRDSNGIWGHKPGQAQARNIDNSGQIITDPETCDRRPYTQFLGYFYAPRSMKVR